MKILVLNGSPRLNGNTSYALKTIADGIAENTQHELEFVNVTRLKIGGCVACEGCRHNGGNCVMKDDSKDVIDKVLAADVLIFGSPVYYFGISSQLKAVLDKFHSRSSDFKQQNKKLGFVTIGADEINDRQYELISDHFGCVCKYLGWEKLFGFSYSAEQPDELQKSATAAAELSGVWKLLQGSGG
ncbi:MAG: flavodoxin family protein [Oscillospiraceae bacterium]|nr:flavodoxin family protein [Oscillospiraceae bacterium]